MRSSATLATALAFVALGSAQEGPDTLKIVSWNIAAINNNPFEYWITHDDAEYRQLMADVQAFIDDPAAGDVPINTVLTPSMVEELRTFMNQENWPNVDAAVEHFNQQYASRPMISGFMKDGMLGLKRLVSMPDRVTNTINVKDGHVVHRPTVINCYSNTFNTPEDWWNQWTTFIFQTPIIMANGESRRVSELIGPISRAKYPSLTEEEETMSRALSTICAAAFDGILVHMMNTIGGGRHATKWQPLRSEMCSALNSRKNERTIEILQSSQYRDADIIFLQEVAGAFVNKMRDSALGRIFQAFVHEGDGKRDQNSAILLRRERFDSGSLQEHSMSFNAMLARQGKKVPVAAGDVLVLSIAQNPWADASGNLDHMRGQTPRFLLASFHGDTNGLATVPVVTAMSDLAKEPDLLAHDLIFGLDANTYEQGSSSKQDVTEFAQAYVQLGLTSCWGDHPDPKNHTTFNARTYLQPQLNKAVGQQDLDKPGVGDKNPKDFILFPGGGKYSVVRTWKDNTGDGHYVEGIPFPTLQFPSDHGILSTIVTRHAH